MTMKVMIGETSVTLKNNRSLLELLNQQGLQQQGIAVAVNDSVIPKNKWESLQLNDGDNITVIKATAGG